ncbi:unnamed protein product [Peniophora sp. CBMAI 1063]|nr:unnamed protein product [Peniophora sp. CBMAI 1063]
MSFVCQQCKQPLQLDASLVDLAPSAYDMLLHSLPPPAPLPPRGSLDALSAPPEIRAAYARASHEQPARRTISPRALGLPQESFVLLQDSVLRGMPPATPSSAFNSPSTSTPPTSPSRRNQRAGSQAQAPPPEPPHEPQSLSHHLRSTQRLLGVLSARTDAEHPLCGECTSTLLSHLSRQLDETKKERDGYAAFEREVRREREREKDGGMSKEEAERRIRELEEEERQAVEAVRRAELERIRLAEELRALEADEAALELEEEEFWRAYNAQTRAASAQQAQLAALRAAYAADAQTLERLERTNVYNDAFCIGHDGPFGTINGLRLGRVPGVPVEWAEVNAAWGQTLLLLYTVARKLDFTFEQYRLVPMGSHSRIERTTGDKATYELYGSGDLHLGRLLHNRRFDFAMVAFLECLRQITDWAKGQDSTIEFPHAIAKDRIGDFSIKLQFSQEEAWTRALRHVLLALKILLKWTTNGSNG